MSLLSRIGKAARLLDLKGDVMNAVGILREVLTDPTIEQHLPEKVEALVFLAELHFQIGEMELAANHLRQLGALDLARVERDLIAPHLRRAEIMLATLEGRP